MKPSELLSDPKRWTKRASARDAENNHLIHPMHKNAVCWCLTGAMIKCDVFSDANYDLLVSKIHRDLIMFNDDPLTTHAEVLNLLTSVGL